jgi:hypothetical protein
LISIQELRHGWPTLVGSMIGLGAGISVFVTTASYFIKPLQAAFGWSRGQMSPHHVDQRTPHRVLVDRYGPRAFILAGSILFALSYLALSAMPGQFIVYMAIIIMIPARLANADLVCEMTNAWTAERRACPEGDYELQFP